MQLVLHLGWTRLSGLKSATSADITLRKVLWKSKGHAFLSIVRLCSLCAIVYGVGVTKLFLAVRLRTALPRKYAHRQEPTLRV